MAKKIGNYLWRLFTLLLFVLVSALTLFFAYGYRIDLEQRDLKKTSIIDVAVREEGVQMFMDGTQQSDSLPYQIKNVEPARHTVTVRKSGFLPWERVVTVTEDIVSIVNDVLLVPEHIEEFVSMQKDFKDAQMLNAGDKYIVSFERGGKAINLTSLFASGVFQDDAIELFRGGLNAVYPLRRETMMLYFDDGSVAWTDFGSRRFEIFRLPKGSEGLQVNPEKAMVYFLFKGDLYGVPFSSLKDLEKDAAAFRIREGVSVYAPVLTGDIYLLSGGALVKTDYLGQEIELVDLDAGNYKNLGYVAGRDHGALLLRDESDRRLLLLLKRDGSADVIEKNLEGQPFFNGYDHLLYADAEGAIHFFDTGLSESRDAGKIEGDSEILGWFSDEGHFLVRKDGAVILRDIFESMNVILMPDTKGVSDFFILNKALFYLKGRELYRISWQKA